ncbi:MAG: hypothetical protein IJE19_03110 [Clostridia bacterium]|nr:hypothetical protein [Clostridia bacterium]
MIDKDTKINGTPLRLFGAELLDYKVGPCEMGKTYFSAPSSIVPTSLKSTVGLRKVELTIDFSGSTMHEIEHNISNLTAILRDKSEIYLPDGFFYTSMLEKFGTPTEKAPWIMQVPVTLVSYRHGSLEIMSITDNMTLFSKGNIKSPAIIEIVPKSDTEVKINDIKVSNIKGMVIIDGISGTVKENGVNKFLDTDMTEFPHLEPGANVMSVDGDADITISYYPIFF